MTSLAFVLGVLPLAIASGAGSGSQNAIGSGVIGGMLSATFLAPFLIPMFFCRDHRKGVREARLGAGVVGIAAPEAAAGPQHEARRVTRPSRRRQGHSP